MQGMDGNFEFPKYDPKTSPAGPPMLWRDVEKMLEQNYKEAEEQRIKLGIKPKLWKMDKVRIYGNKYIDSLPEGEAELASASMCGNVDWIKELVQKKGVNINARLNEQGYTSLHMQVERGDLLACKVLVDELRADIELTEYGGHHALDLAGLIGHCPPCIPEMDIATWLIDKGSEYSWHGAAAAGDIDRINEFLDNGQDIEERGSWYNRTAFQMALHGNRAYIARYLLVKGAIVPRDPAPFNFPEEIEQIAYH